MKKTDWVLGFAAIFLGGLCLLAGAGCGSSPSAPAGPTPTPTVSINWAYPEAYSTNGAAYGYIQIQVNGLPVTDAAVTLSGTFAGAPVTAAYQAPITHSGQVYASYQFQPFTYTAGQTYIFNTTSLGKTASATVAAPGNVLLSLDSNGAVTLADAGLPANKGFVVVEDDPYTTTTFSVSNPTFPVTLAPPTSSVYPGGSGTVYDVDVRAESDTTVVSNATVAFGAIELWEEKDQPVTIP